MEWRDAPRGASRRVEADRRVETNSEDVARQLRVQMQQRAEKQRLQRAALVTTMDSGFLKKVEVRKKKLCELCGLEDSP